MKEITRRILKIRKIVSRIRKETPKKIMDNRGSLFSAVECIDKIYLKEKVKRLFPTNVASGNTVSHSHPLKKDFLKGSVTIDHGFIHEGIKIDTAFSTLFSTYSEKKYYDSIRTSYINYISRLRQKISQYKITNMEMAILFDQVFGKESKNCCKTLMGHRIDNSLHEEPFLQMGLYNNKLLVDNKILEDGYYAIEIYFSKDLNEKYIDNNTDKKRSIYSAKGEYLTYQESRNLVVDQTYFPIVCPNQRVLQIEETFILRNKKLVCLTAKL